VRENQGFYFTALEMNLLIGEYRLMHGLLLMNAERLLSFLKFQFDPGGLVIDFPVASEAHMLAGILGSQLGF
jgi:hypothetical protein